VHDVDQKVLGLDNKLLKSSHKVLNCFFALFKGNEMLFCIVSDVRGLECLLELFSKLIEDMH